MVTYSESGVDIDLEEETVSKLTSRIKETLHYRDVITESGHFAALMPLGDKAIAMSTDGVGSKILIAEMLHKYDTVGIDCIAMVVNDLICVGAEPIGLVDYLAVEKPDPDIADQIGKGLAEGARIAKISIIGGETASLPEIVRNFDLAGTGLGLVDVNKIITGEKIQAGDILIGIESSGIHSNGLSLARKVFFQEAGLSIDDDLPGYPNQKLGLELLKPTNIYVEPIMDLLSSEIEVHGLAHITGGGFNNLKRLKNDISYQINYLPDPQPIFKSINSFNVPIKEMYRVFNMGIGFIVILKSEDDKKALNIIRKYNKAYLIGEAVDYIEQKIQINTFTNKLIEL